MLAGRLHRPLARHIEDTFGLLIRRLSPSSRDKSMTDTLCTDLARLRESKGGWNSRRRSHSKV